MPDQNDLLACKHEIAVPTQKVRPLWGHDECRVDYEYELNLARLITAWTLLRQIKAGNAVQ